MTTAVIASAVRSAIGKKKGAFATMRADDLLAELLRAVVARTKASGDGALIEDVIAGCVTQIGEQGFNIARNAALIAGFPVETTGTTVNRQCGSSQQALHFAAQAIMSGQMESVIAGGIEVMSRIPMGADAALGVAGVAPAIPLSEKFNAKYTFIPQHASAEMIAEKWKISRADCEKFSFDSHKRAAAARESGRFRGEILPIAVKAADGTERMVTDDEGIRPDTSLEKLATLAPVVKPEGVVTAGTSSQISDGAAAVWVTSEARAKALGLTPRARIVATAVAGVDPTMMLHGVIPATHKVLAKAGLQKKDIGLVEINEAFASVPLAWAKELDWDLSTVNVNGGAIALGHPLGCSGVRLMTTLLAEMDARKVRYGLQTMCIGFGQATATIVERF